MPPGRKCNDLPKGAARVGHKHQDVATDHRVKISRQRELSDVPRFERDIPALSIAGSGACDFKDRRICVDAHDCPIWPNQSSGEQGDIAGAASKVQHLHARDYASISK